MLAFIDYPSWLKPEIFSFLNLPANHFLNILRWYGMMYIVALTIAYFQTMYLLKKDEFKTLNKKNIEDLFFWGVLGLVLGGRIFSCIVYDFPYYSKHLLEIVIPFRDGKFVGFQGMAYHGAVIGVVVVCYIYCEIKKLNKRELCDLFFPAVPLGYTFGRLANFINGELYGRITSSPIGMLFPGADKLPLKLNDVQKVMTDLGWKINETTFSVVDKTGNTIQNVLGEMVISGKSYPAINLPRHPSQLYEAFFEGIFLFLIIWFPARKFKPFKGFLAAVYLGGYAIARIVIENFRQPDSQFANFDANKFTGYIIGTLTMGQILSWLMLFSAIAVGIFFWYLSKKDESLLKQHKSNKKK